MRFDDEQRLRALQDYRVLDSPPEEAFDNITQLTAKLFDAPIVLLSLVDRRRQWFKSRVGIAVQQTPREHSICDHALRADATLIVPDATADERFAENPLVTGAPHIRFYCGVPLRSPQGHGLGTLCIIDRKPRDVSPQQLEALRALARQVEIELELRRRLALLEEGLTEQERRQRGKELLSAMIVHDLRSPLTALIMLLSLIQPADEESGEAVRDALAEAERVRLMLGDALDVCLHEAGALVPRRATLTIQSLAARVVHRLQHVAAQRRQQLVLELPEAPINVSADPALLERVLENLIGNAIHHGPTDAAISVGFSRADGYVRGQVRDRGNTIAPEARARIFEVFGRLEGRGPGAYRGYGLGLAFCRFALEAHGGAIGVAAAPDCGNCFYFELPTCTEDGAS